MLDKAHPVYFITIFRNLINIQMKNQLLLSFTNNFAIFVYNCNKINCETNKRICYFKGDLENYMNYVL